MPVRTVPRRPGSILAVMALILALAGSPAFHASALQRGIDCSQVPMMANSTPAINQSGTPPKTPFPEEGTLTVFAAASLTDAFTSIGNDIMEQHPDVTITFNFAGSQALATQLSQGARADVYASADWVQMETMIDAGVVQGEPQTFTRNRLAIVVPASNPAVISQPLDLAQDDLRLVLAQPDVPVGRYSIQSICAMGEQPDAYGEGFVELVQENLVSYEDDVRAVLTKVQLGEADAGIVYVSDIQDDTSNAVSIIEIPPAVNVIATYPIAAIDEGNELTAAFVAYVLGPEGQQTLVAHGFTPLP